MIFGRNLAIQERRAARIAFFSQYDLHANRFGLVLEHLDEAGERQLHEALVDFAAKIYFLFPALVLADDQYRHILLCAQIDDLAACLVQVILDFAVPLRCEPRDSLG